MNIIKKLLSLLSPGAPIDSKVCKTRMVNEQFFECKVRKPNPKYCEHSLSSGDGFICRHEDRNKFLGK
jgi:hypothetical protein